MLLDISVRLFLTGLACLVIFFPLAVTTWPRVKEAPQWAVNTLGALIIFSGLFGVVTIFAAIWTL